VTLFLGSDRPAVLQRGSDRPASPQRAWGTPDRMRIPPAVLVGLAAFILLSYLMLLPDRPTSDWLLEEDGANEWVGTIALFVGSALALSAWFATRHDPDYRGLKRLLLLALGLLLFFGAGEEISWGQRIFGWGTPDELAKNNLQGETNLHNLEVIDGGILSISRLSRIFWLTFTLLIPAACVVSPRLRRAIDRFVPVLPLSLGFLFVLLYVAMKAMDTVFPPDAFDGPFTATHAIVEIREMHIEVIALVAMMCIRFSLRGRRAPRGGGRATAHAPARRPTADEFVT
jgi:hypothetical protein